MGNRALAATIIVLILVIAVVGSVVAYKFMQPSAKPVLHGPGSKYGSQRLLNLLNVHQDWDYTDTRTPNVFELLPDSQMRVQYWDQGYFIGMSSYIANYTVLSPTTIRLTPSQTEKIVAHAPPATLTLTYISDSQIVADDGNGPRSLTR